MHDDDFSALDLLSCGGFRLSAGLAETPVPQKKRFFDRRPRRSGSKGRLASLLPLISRKLPRSNSSKGLKGWPIALSWPTKEVISQELWMLDPGDHSLT